MTKFNGATSVQGNYAEIRKTYPHLTREVVDAIDDAVLAGFPVGTPMSEIGPVVVKSYEWAEDLLSRSPILYGIMQGELLIREEDGGLRFEART